MKRYITIFVLLVFSVFLTACAVTPEEMTAEDVYNIISLATVEVHAESEYVSSLGSGFFLDNQGTVVTNFHVIEDCSLATITDSNGNVYEVMSVLGWDKELDLAILATSKNKSCAVKTSSKVVTGETIYVLGSSLGLTGTFSEGIVSTAERVIGDVVYIQISAPISHGNSGGPVVNAQGEVIGIACAGFTDGQNLNLAVPVVSVENVSTNNPVSMQEFFDVTSPYARYDDRTVVQGSTLAVRTISVSDVYTAEYILALWEAGIPTEAALIQIMDEYGAEQGGGQLYIIDPGVFIAELDEWFFSPERKPGDYAIIENPYGYAICYISMHNANE